MKASVLVPPAPGYAKQTVLYGKGNLRPISDFPVGSRIVPIPCGQCIGCRLEHSRQWAVRLVKESRLHDRNSFLTLTYATPPLTKNGLPTLNLEDIQGFLKRLRKHLEPNKIRFFQCGEYGEEKGRPHHHMILFGEDFVKDRESIEPSPSGFPQWQSKTLTQLWNKGRCTISEFSWEDAAYCARYTLKKWSGSGKNFHYNGRKPEFVTMSRRPGIGADYLATYFSDVYPSDEVAIPGRGTFLPPKYFDKLLEKRDPQLYQKVKAERQKGLDYFSNPDTTDTRLETRERVKQALIKNCLKRRV